MPQKVMWPAARRTFCLVSLCVCPAPQGSLTALARYLLLSEVLVYLNDQAPSSNDYTKIRGTVPSLNKMTSCSREKAPQVILLFSIQIHNTRITTNKLTDIIIHFILSSLQEFVQKINIHLSYKESFVAVFKSTRKQKLHDNFFTLNISINLI